MEQDNFEKLKSMQGQYFANSGSAAGKWLNYKLLLVEKGHIEASILVRDEMTNPSGQLHGGMFALIADELCGLAYYSIGHITFYTTLNLHLDYLYSANKGSIVTIIAKVIRSGKKIGNVECHMMDEHGHLLLHATTNLVNTNRKIFNLTPINS